MQKLEKTSDWFKFDGRTDGSGVGFFVGYYPRGLGRMRHSSHSITALQPRTPTMTQSTATIEKEPEAKFFRCSIPEEFGQAVIEIGGRKLKATVQETSIDGYTVLVAPQYAVKLKVGPTWIVRFDDARVEVYPQWFFNAPDGYVQLGLRRLRDLTEPPKVKTSFLNLGGSRDSSSSSIVVYGGFLLVLFCTLALPGIGEDIGTSDYISAGFDWLVSGINYQLTRIIN